MNQSVAVLFMCLIAAVVAFPQQHGQLSGGGGFNGKGNGGGNVNYQHPNGASGSLGYGHQRGWGHDVSVDARVPVWQSQNGRTSVNAGGGVSQHFGGPMGSRTTDKRVGVGLIHRF